jgi:predicted Ser/Thr protein kinase
VPLELPKNLARWAENSLLSGRNVLAADNQGTVLLFREPGMEFVIKAAMGQGAVRRARQATLEREYRAYQRLHGVAGVPRCHDLLEGKYLVLQYIHGQPYREAVIEDREEWFGQLLETLLECHSRGVAHGDLKSKSNLINTDAGDPCVIDFGTTVLFEKGFHPLGHRMFRYARQLDLNAWVKHKYQGDYAKVSAGDAEPLRLSWLERLLRERRLKKCRKSQAGAGS